LQRRFNLILPDRSAVVGKTLSLADKETNNENGTNHKYKVK